VSEPFDDVHGARRSTSPSPSSFVHEVDHRPFAQGQQHPLVGGREVDEPGEGTEFIAARPDPGRLGSVRLACRQLAEVVAPVPVAIRSGRPHGGDRPSRMAPAHCRHGWSVVVRTRSRRPRNGNLASTFISAWASAEPSLELRPRRL
jgi:hypothetical protein